MKSKAFYAGSNALRLHQTDEEDGTTGLLNGFSKTDAGVVVDVTGEVQSITTDTIDEGLRSLPIFFPFVGATLVASALFSNAEERFNIGVRFLDASQSEISVSDADFIADGRRSHSAIVPATTVYVQWFTTRNAATGLDGTWEFTKPALKTTNALYSP